MPQTFVFEELDEATRDYLLRVRDTKGEGAPGLFTPTASSMAGCGCVAGPIIIVATLVLTLTTVVDVVYEDPVRVAFLQTAGILVGGWLLFAGFRAKASRISKTLAGNWVYVDPLHLYQANREQVTVTDLDNVIDASYTHNYNNGKHQNTFIQVRMGGNATATLTLYNERRAEQVVAFLNYLAWARGPEGGERVRLPPASLGALARYVATNGIEPTDHQGNIDLDLIALDITTVPEEPQRVGRAAPNILPYIVMLIAGVGVFFLMAKVVNPPFRDAAIYNAVSHEPCEPWFLRLYLLDERNIAHRDQVVQRLGKEYDEAIGKLQGKPGDQNLRRGMIEILRSLKVPEQPLVSLKVTETAGPAGGKERVEKLRDGLVGTVQEHKADASAKTFDYLTAQGGIMGELALLMPAVNPPPGMTFPKPRTARGIQMIEFAQMPEDAKHAHFEVSYQIVPDPNNPKGYLMSAVVEIRTNLDGNPVATYWEQPRPIRQEDLSVEMNRFQDRLLEGLVAKTPAAK